MGGGRVVVMGVVHESSRRIQALFHLSRRPPGPAPRSDQRTISFFGNRRVGSIGQKVSIASAAGRPGASVEVGSHACKVELEYSLKHVAMNRSRRTKFIPEATGIDGRLRERLASGEARVAAQAQASCEGLSLPGPAPSH